VTGSLDFTTRRAIPLNCAFAFDTVIVFHCIVGLPPDHVLVIDEVKGRASPCAERIQEKAGRPSFAPASIPEPMSSPESEPDRCWSVDGESIGSGLSGRKTPYCSAALWTRSNRHDWRRTWEAACFTHWRRTPSDGFPDRPPPRHLQGGGQGLRRTRPYPITPSVLTLNWREGSRIRPCRS